MKRLGEWLSRQPFWVTNFVIFGTLLGVLALVFTRLILEPYVPSEFWAGDRAYDVMKTLSLPIIGAGLVFLNNHLQANRKENTDAVISRRQLLRDLHLGRRQSLSNLIAALTEYDMTTIELVVQNKYIAAERDLITKLELEDTSKKADQTNLTKYRARDILLHDKLEGIRDKIKIAAELYGELPKNVSLPHHTLSAYMPAAIQGMMTGVGTEYNEKLFKIGFDTTYYLIEDIRKLIQVEEDTIASILIGEEDRTIVERTLPTLNLPYLESIATDYIRIRTSIADLQPMAKQIKDDLNEAARQLELSKINEFVPRETIRIAE